MVENNTPKGYKKIARVEGPGNLKEKIKSPEGAKEYIFHFVSPFQGEMVIVFTPRGVARWLFYLTPLGSTILISQLLGKDHPRGRGDKHERAFEYRYKLF